MSDNLFDKWVAAAQDSFSTPKKAATAAGTVVGGIVASALIPGFLPVVALVSVVAAPFVAKSLDNN